MRPSLFNVRVPLTGGEDVFLLNTFTDAQAIVSRDVADLLDGLASGSAAMPALSCDAREALDALAVEGFVVASHDDERAALARHLDDLRDDATQLRVTVLTTLQCNFSCGYCVQGDHGPGSAGERMSPASAARALSWIEGRLDAVRPQSLALTFFGGEPLLNLPAVYFLAEGAAEACRTRGVRLLINVITNGLLLTPDVVDRLLPLGLNGVKITLDGPRETHDRQRPLRGGQGTFDRIVENVRRVAGRCRVAIGGNFEAESADRFVELLDFLAAQEFAPLLDKVTFKPTITPGPAASDAVIPLARVRSGAPVTMAPAPARPAQRPASPCDTCHFVDEQMASLREATRARGFRTVDGVHMGPCELHKRHAHTIGPDGSLYACPGFSGEAALAVGHVDGADGAGHAAARARFERLSPWRDACGDCSFVPVCGGGCAVAALVEQRDLLAPSCHKTSFQAGVAALAADAAAALHGAADACASLSPGTPAVGAPGWLPVVSFATRGADQ